MYTPTAYYLMYHHDAFHKSRIFRVIAGTLFLGAAVPIFAYVSGKGVQNESGKPNKPRIACSATDPSKIKVFELEEILAARVKAGCTKV